MRIGFFGCSFTEGGGLDGVEWNKYALKNKLIPSKWDIEKNGNPDEGLDTRAHRDLCEKYAKQHRFSHLVGQKLNCEVENLSQSRSSNEFIIDKLYRELDFRTFNNFDIIVVQFTIVIRRYIWWEPDNRFYNISGMDFSGHPLLRHKDQRVGHLNALQETCANYISYNHNESYEQDKIAMMVDLFDSYGKKIYWMFYEPIPRNCKSKNIIYFEPDGHLHKWSEQNNFTINKDTNGEYQDNHFSVKGHEVIAEKIVEKINE